MWASFATPGFQYGSHVQGSPFSSVREAVSLSAIICDVVFFSGYRAVAPISKSKLSVCFGPSVMLNEVGLYAYNFTHGSQT